jgi:Sec-independent protein translocase protein TatA
MVEREEPGVLVTDIEKLRELKEQLLSMIHAVRSEIRMMKSKYPYTMKGILEDPNRLKAQKEKLTAKLEQYKEMAARYQKKIEEMRRTYG